MDESVWHVTRGSSKNNFYNPIDTSLVVPFNVNKCEVNIPKKGKYLKDLPCVYDIVQNWVVMRISARCPRQIHGFGCKACYERTFWRIWHVWKQKFEKFSREILVCISFWNGKGRQKNIFQLHPIPHTHARTYKHVHTHIHARARIYIYGYVHTYSKIQRYTIWEMRSPEWSFDE